jgi:hypothetical protein
MSDVKDYQCLYNAYQEGSSGKTKLSVTLKTAEFGNMESKLIEGTDDHFINVKLWEGLADELIDEYEFRLMKLRS